MFPDTTVQLCIVHMIRNSTKYVSYKDLKEVTTDLKKIYGATSEEEGVRELEEFAKKWDDKYPVISDIWKRNWTGISILFAFPDEIRKAIYMTNIIEAANRQIRKIIKNKGVFPDDKSIQKIVYLAGVLIQLCHANFSTTEKSYFLLIFNPNLSGNIMSSCDMVKAQSGSGIDHFLLAA